MKSLYLYILMSLCALLFVSCKDNNTESEILERNQWIEEIMRDFYLWSNEIPSNIDPENTADSKAFFEEFRYIDDPWSWISDNYFDTEDFFNGISTTSGLNFYLTFTNDHNIAGVVEYVFPNTPASDANIKRGDIFISINHTTLNIDNYYELLTQGGSYSIDFVKITDGVLSFDRTINITEISNFKENPIFIDTIYQVDNKKIGYLMYNNFLDEYNDEKSLVFDHFKSEAVTDLIIDLRYNTGGSNRAQVHLANLIAPNSAIGEIYSLHHYNDNLTQYYKSRYGDDFFQTKIEAISSNINLSGKLVGIVSNTTASSSESLLNGLDPLLDLTVIGDTTQGKYTSMTVFPDDKKKPQWAIIPIIAKSTNKNNISVKGGIIPDLLLYDNPLDGHQLGDTRETMLSAAISTITTQSSLRHSKDHTNFFQKPIARFKHSSEVKTFPQLIDYKQLDINFQAIFDSKK